MEHIPSKRVRMSFQNRYKINNNSSAVCNHSSSTGHPVSPDDFSIISSTSNSLLIHGNLLILRDCPNLNSQTPSIQLTLFKLYIAPRSYHSFHVFIVTLIDLLIYLLLQFSQGFPCRFCLFAVSYILSFLWLFFTLMMDPRNRV